MNPENEPLGASLNNINLKEIDETTAKNLWCGSSNLDGGLTCDLVTELGSPEMNIFHLDMKFENHKISSYRLRGYGILKPNWVSLNPADSEERKSNATPCAR